MKIQELGIHEIARTGFTHKAIISFANGDFTAAALTQNYDFATLAAGLMVTAMASRLVTALSGGAVATAVFVAGDTGTTNGYLTSTNVFTGSTVPNKAGDGALLNQAGGKAYVGADTLRLTITTSVANVVALTAGEIHVYFTLFDANKL